MPKPLKKLISPTDDGIVYPEICVNEVPIEPVVIDSILAKRLLKWETEADYAARIGGDKASFGEDFLLRDEHGDKVICFANNKNRPFDLTWAKTLAQDILNRFWADSRNGEGRTINGETVIISRTGEVLSAQHRLVGIVLAHQMWEKQPRWKDIWPDGPSIEALVVTGIDGSADGIRTLDNVKPRSLTDVVYTSDIFEKLGSVDRKECSRMMAAAVDLLWRRSGADTITPGTKGSTMESYQTHGSSMDFQDRHSRLTKCVKHLFEENKERAISHLRLSAGQCAGMMYLMGCSKSDINDYRNAEPAPNEKPLDWELWDKAEEFWVTLAGGGKELKAVKEAISNLGNKETGSQGTTAEKTAVIVKAWNAFSEHGKAALDDLTLTYETDKEGKTSLAECPTVGGIDIGDDEGDNKGDELSPEELEEKKVRLKAEKVQRLKDLVAKRNEAKAKAKEEANAKASSAPRTAKEVQAEQTRKAQEADAAAKNGPPPVVDEHGVPAKPRSTPKAAAKSPVPKPKPKAKASK